MPHSNVWNGRRATVSQYEMYRGIKLDHSVCFPYHVVLVRSIVGHQLGECSNQHPYDGPVISCPGNVLNSGRWLQKGIMIGVLLNRSN